MSNDQDLANGLPHGATLQGFLVEVGAIGLEVCACRSEQDEQFGGEFITADCEPDTVQFFGIYARMASGEVAILHDMAQLKPGADVTAAQADAVAYAVGLIEASGLPLPKEIRAPF